MPESVKSGEDGYLYEKCLSELESKGDAKYGICMKSYKEHHMKDSNGNWIRKKDHILKDGKWEINMKKNNYRDDFITDKEFKELPDWVPIFRGGIQTDSNGNEHDGNELINKSIDSFNIDIHEPPVRLDHTDNGGVSYGWIKSLKSEDYNNIKTLYAKLDLTEDMIKLIQDGKYKKRSAGFSPDGKLHHLAMLGSSVPAVKSLSNINLDDGEKNISNFNFEEDIHMPKKEIDNLKDVKTQENQDIDVQDQVLTFSEEQLNKKLKEQEVLFNEKIDDVKTKLTNDFEEEKKEIQFSHEKEKLDLYISELQKNGKITPKMIDSGLKNFMEYLLKDNSDQLNWFKNFIENKEQVIQIGEFDSSEKRVDDMDVDKKIDKLISEKMKSENIEYSEAFGIVQLENKELFD